jgi:hypothetical protein
MPKCPFKILTGLNCPACGIQRAIHAALMGHWAQAIKYNYFLLFAGPYVLSFAVQYLMPQSRAKQRLGVVLSNRYLVNTYVVTFLVWLAVRNLPKIRKPYFFRRI